MVMTALRNLGLGEPEIQSGLKKISNPGRFEWLSPTVIIDTANNKENIKILSKMIQKIAKGRQLYTFFGTTQTDTNYATQLAQMIPTEHRILVDGFCERALPVATYNDGVKNNKIINLSTDKGKMDFYSAIEHNGPNAINLIY